MAGSESPTPPLVPADGSESENALLAISLSVEVPGVKDIVVGDTPGGIERLRRSSTRDCGRALAVQPSSIGRWTPDTNTSTSSIREFRLMKNKNEAGLPFQNSSRAVGHQ